MWTSTVEKPKTCSPTFSAPSCHPTSPPLWIHPGQAYVSDQQPNMGISFNLFLKCCIVSYMNFNVDSKVILAIRRAEHLKRLVYVACNAKAAMNNFVEWVEAAVKIQSVWRPVLQKSYIRIRFLACAEHRLTEFTGRPSGRCGPWPLICSPRPCTWRCSCSWREWTTIPSSNSPAALRKRPETEPVALVLQNRIAYFSIISC